ncbi:hypothetical protein INT45_012214 [Circinella minor]|uniref:Uncharacterized protein n=1 Tax=Circinella minor TaxID=1195481 RepID=A0A8H7S0Q5_9FUNG|nr:hypothetical protein INT45_012214 [Circinella minor]
MSTQRQNSWTPLKKNIGQQRSTNTRPLPIQGSHGSETSTPNQQDEVMRKHSEEYNIRLTMKATMLQASTTSYGFYIPKSTKYDNFIIPAIPRVYQQQQQ